jgi:hypothetical protein
MNKWWKLALGGAAGAGLLAASGGTLAAPLSGLLGTAGEGAAAGAAATGAAGEAAAGAATGAAADASASAAGAALPGAFVTPPVAPWAPVGPLSGVLEGTDMAYGSPAAINSMMATTESPGMLAQAGGYAKTAGKAASAYSTVNQAMGGQQMQPAPPPPPPRPYFSGDAPSFAQAAGAGMQPAPNQNAILAAIARRRQRGF